MINVSLNKTSAEARRNWKVNKNSCERPRDPVSIIMKIAQAARSANATSAKKNLSSGTEVFLHEAKQIPYDIRNLTSITFRAIFYKRALKSLQLLSRTPQKIRSLKQAESIWEATRNGMKEIFARNGKNVNGIFLSFWANFRRCLSMLSLGWTLRNTPNERRYRQNKSETCVMVKRPEDR